MKVRDLLSLAVVFLFSIVISMNISCGGSSGGGGSNGGGTDYVAPDMNLSTDEPDKVVTDSDGQSISSNKVVVSFVDGVTKNEIDTLVSSLGGSITGNIPAIDSYEITFDTQTAAELETKITSLLNDSSVESAEKNYVFHLEALDVEQSDSSFLTEPYYTIELIKAHQLLGDKTLSDVNVAVIDSGFDLGHYELDENYSSKYRFDFADIDFDVSSEWQDKSAHAHGTKVAGIIAAENGNNQQATDKMNNDKFYFNGVAPNARIMPLKVIPNVTAKKEEGFMIKLAAAIVYAAYNGADVINISAGWYGDHYVDYLHDAIKYAVNEKGVAIIASAGNAAIDASGHYPSAFPEVISVGATDNNYNIIKFQKDGNTVGSNYSDIDDLDVLTVSAPVKQMNSTIPYYGEEDPVAFDEIGPGTSFSAPMVSGLAALIKSLDDSLTPSQIRQIIIDNSDLITVTDKNFNTHNWHSINVYNALSELVDIPSGMALIPAGCFDMGEAFSGDGDNTERPVHNVCISSFYMDVHEVTNAEYAACVSDGGCTAPGSSDSYTRSPYYGNPTYDNFPVIYVSWNQATDYCTWAGKRLPTEAEWEYAARGGLSGKRYPWGDTATACVDANFDDCIGDTSEVGSYPANGYGLYDVGGNVWEWTNDWYKSDYYQYCVDNNIVNAPQGPDTGTQRVARGGDWGHDYRYLRVADRHAPTPTDRNDGLGFRCAGD